jgi:short-subunit dehydrogenase
MDLRGRHVLLTGASRGIGELVARKMAASGCDLSLVARSGDLLESIATELGGRAFVRDLSDPDQVADLVAKVEAEAGPVDVLVNNAAVYVAGAFENISSDVLAQILKLNLLAAMELTRQALPGMVGRGRGHIVNMSSLAGTNAAPGAVAYSTTKSAMSHFTAGLRADLRGTDVRTTLVQLGPVSTDMIREVESYGPTQRAIRRFRHLGLLTEENPDQVASAIVRAVQRGKRHVRFPKRALLYYLSAEMPRRLTEVLLTGVDHRSA